MNADDPRLTAHLLGELAPADRAEVEAALAADPALRAEAATLRGAITELQRGLPREAGWTLAGDQRSAVLRSAAITMQAPVAPRPPRRARAWRTALLTAAAAVVLGTVLVPAVAVQQRQRAPLGEPTAVGTALVPRTPAAPAPPTGPAPIVIADPVGIPADHGARPLRREESFARDTAAVADDGAPALERAVPSVDPDRHHGTVMGEAAPPASGAGDLFGYRRGADAPSVPPTTTAPRIDPAPATAARPSPAARETIRPDPAAPVAPVTGDDGFRRTDLPGGDVSTFAVDVDTASYAHVRRLLRGGQRPPPEAVRIEELVNYFPYDYTAPPADAREAFAAHAEVAPCPWNERHLLARLALRARTLDPARRAPANLVFLVDVSGSMDQPNKLPLLKDAFRQLVAQLDGRDRVAIVTYAGESGIALHPTSAAARGALTDAIDRLRAGGSTNGASGIGLAYQVAREGFIPGGVNRVILATDGDFNVGVTDRDSLVRMVAENARGGVELTVLGFGIGDYRDGTMQALATSGDGNHAYIDSAAEARKVLVDDLVGTLQTVATDAKVQVFFNPARVAGWRLIGYENRRLAASAFNDDRVDAGEIGAGHTVTMLYELLPAGGAPGVDANPFVAPDATPAAPLDDALLRLRVRTQPPGGGASALQEFDVRQNRVRLAETTPDYRWAAAVAGFGLLLRGAPDAGALTWAGVRELAVGARGADRNGLRSEFIGLIGLAERLCPPAPGGIGTGTRLAPLAH